MWDNSNWAPSCERPAALVDSARAGGFFTFFAGGGARMWRPPVSVCFFPNFSNERLPGCAPVPPACKQHAPWAWLALSFMSLNALKLNLTPRSHPAVCAGRRHLDDGPGRRLRLGLVSRCCLSCLPCLLLLSAAPAAVSAPLPLPAVPAEPAVPAAAAPAAPAAAAAPACCACPPPPALPQQNPAAWLAAQHAAAPQPRTLASPSCPTSPHHSPRCSGTSYAAPLVAGAAAMVLAAAEARGQPATYQAAKAALLSSVDVYLALQGKATT